MVDFVFPAFFSCVDGRDIKLKMKLYLILYTKSKMICHSIHGFDYHGFWVSQIVFCLLWNLEWLFFISFGYSKDTTGPWWFKIEITVSSVPLLKIYHNSVNGLSSYSTWNIPTLFGVSSPPHVIICQLPLNIYLLSQNSLLL